MNRVTPDPIDAPKVILRLVDPIDVPIVPLTINEPEPKSVSWCVHVESKH